MAIRALGAIAYGIDVRDVVIRSICSKMYSHEPSYYNFGGSHLMEIVR